MASIKGEEEERKIDIKTGQVFEYVCEFCKEADLDIGAEGYCMDCKEYLCQACFDAHSRSRSTRHHGLLDQEHMPRRSPLSKCNNNKFISTRCEIHRGNIVQYYCVSHKSLVCTACFLKEHRFCDEIEVVLDKSKDIIDSHEHLDFIRNLKEMEKRSSFMATRIHDCKDISMQCFKNMKKQISDATREFHAKVDCAEQSLMVQMEAILSEDNVANDELEEIDRAIRVMREETEKIVASRRVCQLYIHMKVKQNEVEFLENWLTGVEGRKYVETITFEPNDEVRNAFCVASLGQLTARKERTKSESHQVTTTNKSIPFACPENVASELDQCSPRVDEKKVPDVSIPQLSVAECPVTELLPLNRIVDEVSAIIDKPHQGIPSLEEVACIPNGDHAQSEASENTQDKTANRINYDRDVLLQFQFSAPSMCLPEGFPDFPKIIRILPNPEQEQVQIVREITDWAKTSYVLDSTATQLHKQKALPRNTPLEQRLKHFTKAIATPSKCGFKDTLEDEAYNAALTITIVTNSDNQNHFMPAIECHLFLEDIWITKHSGTESKKQECVEDLYRDAWTLVSHKQAIDVTKTRRLSNQDLFGPFMESVKRIEVGACFFLHSNAKTLVMYGHDLSKVANRRLEDVISFELDEWSSERQKNAFRIIELSCKLIGMLLQCKMSVLNSNTAENIRFQVYIQHHILGDSYGWSKARAKQLAFEEALYKIYEKQRVIRINRRGDLKNWILYDDLKKEAEEMKAHGMKPGLPVCDDTGKTISSYVVKAAYKRVKSFLKENADEIVFAPGMSTDEINAICYIGRKLKLKCDKRSQKGHSYFALLKHIDWSEIFEQMSPTTVPDGNFSKYCRVDKNDIPKSTEESGVHKETEKNNDTIMSDTLFNAALSKSCKK